jgi:hypothetical protein
VEGPACGGGQELPINPAGPLGDAHVFDGDAVIRHLGALGRDLETEITLLAELEELAVDTEGDFRKAFAAAYAEAAGTLEDRKQRAIAGTDAQWRTWGKAVAAVRRQRESLKALHARIDIGRTMASREKALVSLAGQGGAP